MSTVLKANSNPAVDALTDEDMDNLRHIVGADPQSAKSSWGHRNYFAASPNTPNHESMERLVAAGYAKCSGERFECLYYHATPEGLDALGFTKAQKQRAMDW